MAKNEAKIKFLAETSEFTEQIKRANQSMSELRSEMKLSEAQFKGNEQSVDALTEKKLILQKQLSASTDKIEALRKKLQSAKDIYGESSTEVSKLKTQLNNAERQYVDTENAIKDVNQALENQGEEAQETTTAIKGLNDGFTVMKGVVANLVTDGIRLLVDGLKDAAKYAIQTGMDFEAGMSQVMATSGASADEMELLTAEAMRVGEITKFSGLEAAQGLNYMAMAGWKADDMLAGLEGMANLAAAANTDLGTASDIVTDTLTAMGYAAGDSAKLADVMAAAASNANTNVELMGYTFKYAAPVAGSLGFNMEDLAIATGLMANAGIKGEQAGTTLRAGLTNLIKPTEQMATYMDKYGISVTNSDGTVKSLSETMEILRNNLGGLPEAEQAAAAAAIFGKEAMSGWLAVINSSDEDFAKLSTAIYGSDGAAKEMAQTMQDNLKGDIEELGGAVDTLAIKVQSSFNGALRDGVQAIHGFITGSTSMNETFSLLSGAVGQAFTVIQGYLPKLGEIGLQLISNLAQGIINGVPMLITGAANLIKTLGDGVQVNAPNFISKALDLLNGFADSLTQSVPVLVQNGMQFIRNLVKGLMDSLPELISRVPEIISKFANVINDNAPTIIAGGVGIIKDLIVGIVKAIPTLVQNIPKIITAIIDVWQAFDWASLGKKAITLLKDGIVKTASLVKTAGLKIMSTITDVLKNLPSKLLELGKGGITGLVNGIKAVIADVKSVASSIFDAVWNGIASLPDSLLGVGKDLVKGLWNGISDMTGWVLDKINGFGDSVLSGIKRFFGIQSPSRVMKDEVGRYLAEGVGEGIAENEGAAIEPMRGIVDKIKGIDVAGEWGKLSGAGGSLSYDVSAQLGDYVSSAIGSNSPYAILGSLIEAVEDLASRPIDLSIDGYRFATATASASDNVSGSRLNLRNRGIAL